MLIDHKYIDRSVESFVQTSELGLEHSKKKGITLAACALVLSIYSFLPPPAYLNCFRSQFDLCGVLASRDRRQCCFCSRSVRKSRKEFSQHLKCLQTFAPSPPLSAVASKTVDFRASSEQKGSKVNQQKWTTSERR
jgi:hypothetical protein